MKTMFGRGARAGGSAAAGPHTPRTTIASAMPRDNEESRMEEHVVLADLSQMGVPWGRCFHSSKCPFLAPFKG
jgi:hypothetical protein